MERARELQRCWNTWFPQTRTEYLVWKYYFVASVLFNRKCMEASIKLNKCFFGGIMRDGMHDNQVLDRCKKIAYLQWAPLCTVVSAPCWPNVFVALFRLSRPRGVWSQCRCLVGLVFVWHVNGVYGCNEYYINTSPYISICRGVRYVGDMGIKRWYFEAERQQTATRMSRRLLRNEATRESRVWLIGLCYSLCVTIMRDTETYESTSATYENIRICSTLDT